MRRSALAFSALLILLCSISVPVSLRGQQVTHEVVKGETLWSIAQHYLGNGNQWTTILEANRATLTDPDRIEVGMVLVIPGLEPPAAEVQEVSVVTAGEPVEAQMPPPAMEPTPVPTRQSMEPCPGPNGRTIFYEGGDGGRGCTVPTPESRTAFYFDPEAEGAGAAQFVGPDAMVVAVAQDAVFSAEWLATPSEAAAGMGRVTGFARMELDRSNRTQAMTHELVQVEMSESAGLQEGDLVQSYMPYRKVDGLGWIMRPTGLLEVTSLEGAGVVARVVKEYGRVRLGNQVRPLPSYSLAPGQQAEPVDSEVTATILSFAQDRVIYPVGSTALLDIGEDEGVTIGDEFVAYVDTGTGWAGRVAARLQVVLVDGNISTARITSIREPTVDVGDQVRLAAKMR